MPRHTRSTIPVACAAGAMALVLASTAAHAQGRYTPSADGQEVSDSKTGLVWRRCAEGMVFKGKACTGQATFFTQTEAATRAKSAGGDWRLPVLKELSSIAAPREAGDGHAAIDPQAFPNTPLSRFWTSSSTGPGYFTYVAFVDGSAGEGPRSSPGAVRLVRGGGAN